MKRIILTMLASLAAAAAAAYGQSAELNVSDGTIESPDGMFVGRDFKVVDGFKLELLYRPSNDEGKWVAMAWDDKGRLIIPSYNSDVLNRVTIPRVGSNDPVKVEKIDTTKVGAAEGVVYAFNSLYLNSNRSNTMRSGMYRLLDTNGDDKYDETRVIRNRQGDASDHGTHTLRLSPDGKWIVQLSGNATRLTEHNMSLVPDKYLGEDRLIIRPDLSPPGFHRTPDGNIIRYNEDGSNVELFADGFRNPVSFDYNKDGEMFLYDADEEPNMGFTPGYRPTNVIHVIPGEDAGWRSGWKVHPFYYFDNFGTIAVVGSGSPVGGGFGIGAKFPARYQDAYFIDDWSFGNLWAVYLSPEGSSYKASVQPFISGRPFAVSGTIVNPADGSLLVQTTGTELYRVTYVGNEDTTPTKPDTLYKPFRDIRHSLEAFEGHQDAKAVDTVWPYLSDQDRATRYAARVALEWQDVNTWRERALNETNPRRAIAAIAALARDTAPDIYHEAPGSNIVRDKNLESRMLTTLNNIDWETLSYQDKLDLLRAYEIVMIRMGMPNQSDVDRLIARLDPYLPAKQEELNMELSEVLIYLQAPSAAEKVMALLRDAPSEPYYGVQEWPNPQQRQRQDRGTVSGPNLGLTEASMMRQDQQEYYAVQLRILKTGWTPDLKKEFLTWMVTAPAEWTGAVSNNIGTIRADFELTMTDAEKAQYQDLLDTPIPSAGGRGGFGGGRGGANAAAAGGPAGAAAGGAAAAGGRAGAAAGGANAAAAAGGRGGFGGFGGRGGTGTPALQNPEQSLYIPFGGAGRAFDDVELTELTKYDESMEKQLDAQTKATDALAQATWSLPSNSANIAAKVNDLANAELALALARADGYSKLKSDLGVSGEDQTQALITSINTHGGRGVFLGGGGGGAGGGRGAGGGPGF